MDDFEDHFVMDESEMILCHICGKEFYRHSTFESHMKWKHCDRSEEYMCELCGRTFQKKYNLIKHMESGAHFVLESVKCAIHNCDFRSINRKLMGNHYQSCHKIFLQENTFYFTTVDEFFNWKSAYEAKTRSRYVKMSSSRQRKNGFIRSTYFCHRDGNFIPKGKNLRHPKMKGSNKINAHCPAKIDVEMGDNIVVASCVETHLGHDLDITRLSLEPEEKALIAEKLAMKVPFEQILEEVNNSNKSSLSGEVKRLNLLTRKDLWNIVETFKLNPKDVVYSKTRMRKNKIFRPKKELKMDHSKKLELLKRESRIQRILDKKKKMSVTVEDQEVNSSIPDELANYEIVSVGKEGNVFYGPLIVKGENGEYQEYALVTEENEGGEDDSYLVINSQGELESLSGQKIFITEDGKMEMQESDPPEEPDSGSEMVMKESENSSDSLPLTEEIKCDEDKDESVIESFTINHSIGNTKHSKLGLNNDNSSQVVSKQNQLKQKFVDESNIFYIENLNDEEIDADSQLVKIEQAEENEEFELVVDEDGNQYMIISSKEELNSNDISLLTENIGKADADEVLVHQEIINSGFLKEATAVKR